MLVWHAQKMNFNFKIARFPSGKFSLIDHDSTSLFLYPFFSFSFLQRFIILISNDNKNPYSLHTSTYVADSNLMQHMGGGAKDIAV